MRRDQSEGREDDRPRGAVDRWRAEIAREADQKWESDGKLRREFCRDVGHMEHRQWGNEIRERERKRGRKEGSDFAVEHTLEHPREGSVRLDYVDLKRHRITDLKPHQEGTTVSDVARRYEKQRVRHIEAYEARYKKTPEYDYDFYKSPQEKDIRHGILFGDTPEENLRRNKKRASGA